MEKLTSYFLQISEKRKLNYFEKKVFYILFWIELKWIGIEHSYFEYCQKQIKNRTKHLDSTKLDYLLKEIQKILNKEISIHFRTRRNKPTYIGFEGMMFQKIESSWNFFSKEYNYYKRHPLVRLFLKKENIQPDPFIFHNHGVIPYYFATTGMITDQRIVICSKGTNLKTEVIENNSQENEDDFVSDIEFIGQENKMSEIRLVISETKSPDLITEIYFEPVTKENKELIIKEIKMFEK